MFTSLNTLVALLFMLFSGAPDAPKPNKGITTIPDADTIKLLAPRKSFGKNIMSAFWERRAEMDKDVRSEPIRLQELSELMWVAYGINRDNGHLVVPTQQNAQNGDVFAILPTGAYHYDRQKHELHRVNKADLRSQVAWKQTAAAGAPMMIVIVMHPETLKVGDDETRKRICYAEGGIVSQNISIYCSGAGLRDRPRATMDREALRTSLKLDDKAYLVLNHLIAYSN